MAEAKPLVTITGISGFLGSWVCLYFLQDGGFRVRGTVRSKTNAAKVQPIKDAFGEELFSQLELVEADLMNEQSLIDACAGSTYVVHTASPVVFSDNPDDVIPPAINGTVAAMKACQAAGARRIVITSSCAAVQAVADADRPADNVFDETIWSNPDRPQGMGAYLKSKTLAEKAAWDFQAALPEDQRFEIATICPGAILGPPLKKEQFASDFFVRALMTGKAPHVKSEHFCMVDVRDCAMAHVHALKNPAAANRRFLTIHSSPSMHEWGRPVVEKYKPLGWPVPDVYQEVDPNEVYAKFNNAASQEIGVTYRPITETMVEMADKMVENGSFVKPE